MPRASHHGRVAVVVAALAAALACSHAPAVGFWYENDALTLPAGVAARIGGPLTGGERMSITQLSYAEVEHAFSGLPVSVTANERAFWRVAVLQSLPPRGRWKVRALENRW